MIRWFAVHTHANAEEKALRNLERQGFQVYLPRYLKKRRHARRVDMTPAPLFPRYLFVGMDPETTRWRAINSTFGVSNIVATGNRPLDVPGQIIENIRDREDERGWVSFDPVLPYCKGEKVQIKEGPMRDQIALFECADDNERVLVLLDLMGRTVKIGLNAESIGPTH